MIPTPTPFPTLEPSLFPVTVPEISLWDVADDAVQAWNMAGDATLLVQAVILLGLVVFGLWFTVKFVRSLSNEEQPDEDIG